MNNILENISKIFKVISIGLETMSAKADEIIASSKQEAPVTVIEVKKEEQEVQEIPVESNNKIAIAVPEVEVKEPDTEVVKPAPKKRKKKVVEKPVKIAGSEEKAKEEQPIKQEPDSKQLDKKTDEKKVTKTDTILEILKKSKKPLSIAEIKEKTGFADRAVLDVLNNLHKKEKVKRVSRGVYTKV